VHVHKVLTKPEYRDRHNSHLIWCTITDSRY